MHNGRKATGAQACADAALVQSGAVRCQHSPAHMQARVEHLVLAREAQYFICIEESMCKL